jgi:hopene-associated glycosyltransferase HpnB
MTALAAVAGLALGAWVWLALLRGGYWRTDVRLQAGAAPASWPSVAVVIPARDEAAVLPTSLPTVLAQLYPGSLRVILVDDGSTDGTGELARTLAGARGQPDASSPTRPLSVIQPGRPPAGWTGKLWALAAGVAEAGPVELLLFTDADIAHRPDSLVSLVRAAEGRDLVSQMARLRTGTTWERLIVPAFVYFFALLYPFRWSNRPGHRVAAAAGGCVLVRRVALERAGGLAEIRSAVIDDVALARLVKRSGGRTYIGLAERVDSVRAYAGLGALWAMVSRSAYAQLRYSMLLLAGTVCGLAGLFLVPPLATVAAAVDRNGLLAVLGVAGWLLLATLYVPTLRYYRQRPWYALGLPFVAVLYLAMTVDSARAHYQGRGGAWKGRTY